MSAPSQINASVLIRILNLQLSNFTETPTTKFNVVGEYNGRTLYGVTHIGNHKNLNDNIVVNLQNLDFNDLDLVIFADDQELGRGSISFMDVITSSSNILNQRVELRNNFSLVGYINAQIIKSKREQIVGGLKPPLVSLRNGAALIEELRASGIQKVKASNLNFFSCMDAKDMGWEFYPYSFETKLKSTYGDH